MFFTIINHERRIFSLTCPTIWDNMPLSLLREIESKTHCIVSPIKVIGRRNYVCCLCNDLVVGRCVRLYDRTWRLRFKRIWGLRCVRRSSALGRESVCYSNRMDCAGLIREMSMEGPTSISMLTRSVAILTNSQGSRDSCMGTEST